MNANILKKITFKGSDSIRTVLSKINKSVNITNGKGFGIIVDDSNKCIGVVTDGDIRRKLITDVDLDDNIEIIMNKDFKFIRESDSDYVKLKKMSMFNNLPIVDNDNLLIEKDKKRLRPEDSEVERLYCDNSKLLEHTNWEQQYSLDAGLIETIEWIKSNRSIYKTNMYHV